ncbi:DUF3290 family protein [Bifidobacterium tsurumiense]|uniref:DUF3290 family protein n=1 Tax=Bifidobacterium tsurumiense TaxID=356829 RepID=UPI0012B380C4|nr:DUF3290 family protein [Bifidobacterium tsurumiense]MDY4678112.1 DUF3290 family protein [Bifidobacterium tsurumiense]MSS12026.1 DUF3290 domain-containing protein [Bifidobacterium tsurumiense]
MKLYSYGYLTNQSAINNGIQIAMTAVMVLLLCASLFRLYKTHGEVKYRELSLILIVGLLIMGFIKFDEFQQETAKESSFANAAQVVESVAKKLEVDTDKVYISSASSLDGTLIAVDNHYYRIVASDNSDDGYVLESITLKNPDIELVEAQ